MNYELFIQDLCKKAGEILVNLPNELNGRDINPLQLYSKLIFPKYENNDKKIRVSEQEARFAFCQVFEQANHGLYYSIETPTENNYSFKNGIKLDLVNGQSARSDMSIFSLTESGFNQIINIEFKAHNVEYNHIKKDFLKLLEEPQNGLFFHVLESVVGGTLNTGTFNEYQGRKGIFKKYGTSIINLFEKLNNKIGKDWFLFIAICILSPEKYLITKTFRKSNFDNIEDFFEIEYTASRKSISFLDNKRNGWEVTPF